jgi:hypothetical protein
MLDPPCGIGEVGILCLAPPEIFSGSLSCCAALGNSVGRGGWRERWSLVGVVEEDEGELVRWP